MTSSHLLSLADLEADDRRADAARRAPDDARLRDQFAVAAYSTALAAAIRGYGHICPTVTDRAVRLAYEAADAAMAWRAKNPPPEDAS